MSTVTSILGTDLISDSRSVINANFGNLNADKVQISSVASFAVATISGSNAIAPVASNGTSGQVLTSTGPASLPTFQTPAGAPTVSSSLTPTLSLTTAAGQAVVVWAKYRIASNGGTSPTITLKYNGVTKDTVETASAGGLSGVPGTLMYTEVPGAATQDVTVETSAGSIDSVVIIALKI